MGILCIRVEIFSFVRIYCRMMINDSIDDDYDDDEMTMSMTFALSHACGQIDNCKHMCLCASVCV